MLTVMSCMHSRITTYVLNIHVVRYGTVLICLKKRHIPIYLYNFTMQYRHIQSAKNIIHKFASVCILKALCSFILSLNVTVVVRDKDKRFFKHLVGT